MPEISRFYGIVIKMFFDDHNPPHFHVEYQEYDAIVHIQDGVMKGEMPKRALKMVFEWMELHREELLLNWNSMQSTGDYIKIEPLK